MFFHFNWYLCDWFKAKKSKLNSFFLQKFIDTQHTFPQTANSNSTGENRNTLLSDLALQPTRVSIVCVAATEQHYVSIFSLVYGLSADLWFLI